MSRGATLRSSWVSHGVTGCAGIVIGAVLMSFWGQHSPISQAALPSADSGPVVATPADSAAIDSRIQQVIREELAHHDAIGAALAAPAAPAAISAVASPEIVAQTERAHAVLDAATTRLSWSAEDATEFRSLITVLPAAERQALMLKFAQAVNDRGMRLESGGAPF
jgi:hypothetical protein